MVFDESSTDVEKCDDKYLTALHLAAKHGQIDCVEELLKRGANPNRYIHVYQQRHCCNLEAYLKKVTTERTVSCIARTCLTVSCIALLL
jgi:ankyrin repeat protein